MSLTSRALVGVAVLGTALIEIACFDTFARGTIERQAERVFTVAPGSAVQVRISGGGIRSTTGEPGTVRITLRQRIAADSDQAADRALADYDITLVQEGDTVRVVARPRSVRRSDWAVLGATGCVLAGVALPLAIQRVIGPGHVLLGGTLAGVAAGAILLASLHGRAEGWKISIGILTAFALYSVVR